MSDQKIKTRITYPQDSKILLRMWTKMQFTYQEILDLSNKIYWGKAQFNYQLKGQLFYINSEAKMKEVLRRWEKDKKVVDVIASIIGGKDEMEKIKKQIQVQKRQKKPQKSNSSHNNSHTKGKVEQNESVESGNKAANSLLNLEESVINEQQGDKKQKRQRVEQSEKINIQITWIYGGKEKTTRCQKSRNTFNYQQLIEIGQKKYPDKPEIVYRLKNKAQYVIRSQQHIFALLKKIERDKERTIELIAEVPSKNKESTLKKSQNQGCAVQKVNLLSQISLKSESDSVKSEKKESKKVESEKKQSNEVQILNGSVKVEEVEMKVDQIEEKNHDEKQQRQGQKKEVSSKEMNVSALIDQSGMSIVLRGSQQVRMREVQSIWQERRDKTGDNADSIDIVANEQSRSQRQNTVFKAKGKLFTKDIRRNCYFCEKKIQATPIFRCLLCEDKWLCWICKNEHKKHRDCQTLDHPVIMMQTLEELNTVSSDRSRFPELDCMPEEQSKQRVEKKKASKKIKFSQEQLKEQLKALGDKLDLDPKKLIDAFYADNDVPTKDIIGQQKQEKSTEQTPKEQEQKKSEKPKGQEQKKQDKKQEVLMKPKEQRKFTPSDIDNKRKRLRIFFKKVPLEQRQKYYRGQFLNKSDAEVKKYIRQNKLYPGLIPEQKNEQEQKLKGVKEQKQKNDS